MKLWTVYGCDCGLCFALPKFDSFPFPMCPSCGSEDTTTTGEYIVDKLVNEDGKEI